MLSVNSVTFERYFEPVFEPASFALSAGELLLIKGANGSGKTTLLRVLAGLLQPSTGTVLLPDGRAIVYIGHSLALKESLTVMENLVFFMRFFGAADTPGCDTLINRLDLAPVVHQQARTLSAGQRKRCALARLLIQPNGLWLLDEPYSNLDVDGVDLVNQLLKEHLDRTAMAIVASHGQLLPDGLEYQSMTIRTGRSAA